MFQRMEEDMDLNAGTIADGAENGKRVGDADGNGTGTALGDGSGKGVGASEGDGVGGIDSVGACVGWANVIPAATQKCSLNGAS